MRKKIFGKQLQRDTNERKALFKSLMEALVLRESIKTTEAKAKAVKGQVEKLVTKARVGGVKAERALQPYFAPSIMKKLINDIAPRFANRPGGYTRITKLGSRFSDNTPMVILEWVIKNEETSSKKQETNKKDVVASKAKQSGSEEKLEATTPAGSAKQNTKKNKTSAKTSKSKKSSSGGK